MLQPNQYAKALRNGLFFITICTKNRHPIFAEDPDNALRICSAGMVAKHCWEEIPIHFAGITLDEYVVMPDHLHGIISFMEKPAIFGQKFGKPMKGSVETIVKTYKAAVTRGINTLPNFLDYKAWQRGYYEHRIRNEYELQKIRKYIRNNPYEWNKKMNPENDDGRVW